MIEMVGSFVPNIVKLEFMYVTKLKRNWHEMANIRKCEIASWQLSMMLNHWNIPVYGFMVQSKCYYRIDRGIHRTVFEIQKFERIRFCIRSLHGNCAETAKNTDEETDKNTYNISNR